MGGAQPGSPDRWTLTGRPARSHLARLAAARSGAAARVGAVRVGAVRVGAVRVGAILVTLVAATILGQVPAGAATRVATAPAAAHQAALDAVSCAQTTLCIAVGTRAVTGGSAPLAEKWNGSAWTDLVIPAPHATDASLASVSCPTSTDCTAVGEYAQSQSKSGPLAEQWNGHRWRITQDSDPAGVVQGNLAGVSCASVRDCVAVGTRMTTDADLALSERWNGHRWQVLKDARVHGSALFAGVHCTGSFCMAVGEMSNSASTGLVVMAQKLAGSTWTALKVPAPAGANLSALYGVWCTTSSFCLSGGQQQGRTNGAVAYAWTGGSSWTRQSLSAANEILFGISCGGTASCMAVGSGLTRPVSQFWDGTAWTPVPTAPLSRAPFAALVGVSCPAATVCIAVGSRTNGSPADIGTALAQEWNGSGWHLLTAVTP